MLLGAVLVLMTLIVLALVVAPLLRPVRAAPERARFDRAVYRDQLREVERDLARGVIAPGDGRSARLEIERRLLATDTGEARPPAMLKGSPLVAILLAAIVAAGTWAAYLHYGAPDVPDQPFASRAAERALAQSAGPLDLGKTAAALEAKVKAKPDDAEAWLMLGRTDAALGHWQQGADAFRRAMALTGGRADVTAAYGEMLVLAADGIVTPGAHDAFAAALARDAANPVARYYMALAKAQQGDAPGALADWRQLAADVPAQSPMRPDIEKVMTETAARAGLPAPAPLAAPAPPGPDEAAVAAASKMDPAARQAMIRGMVEKLAADMAQHPDDIQGWLRLARSYGVLGDTGKAGDAYERAARLKPDDFEIPLAEAELLITSQPIEEPFSPRALDALHRAATLKPDDPAVLWYGGLAAAKDRDFATAAADWQKLLAVLPADSADRKAVAEALASIKDK